MLLSEAQQQCLLGLASQAIHHGLLTGKLLKLDTIAYPHELTTPCATFVTLHANQKLRGCIGVLDPIRPLVEDIVSNAFSAAFKDTRFPPLLMKEYGNLEVELSLLTPAEPVVFTSEEELLSQLHPGLDGLIFKAGSKRATFLPSVWQSLPKPQLFLNNLKQKAGLPPDFWSDDIQIYRYHTQTIA